MTERKGLGDSRRGRPLELGHYRRLRALSDPLANIGKGGCGVRFGGAAAGLDPTAGNRPDTVQHVVGERKEQASSGFSEAAGDWVLAAQLQRNATTTAPIPARIDLSGM